MDNGMNKRLTMKARMAAINVSRFPRQPFPAMPYLLHRPPWMEEMQTGCREQPVPCSRATACGSLALACILWTSLAMAQIYKVVDADGNITYTDQAPPDGSPPMKLPELSVIASDVPEETPATEGDAAAVETAAPVEPTPRELRKMYQDFHITRPVQEETFWGTANAVVVQWGSSTELQADMKVRVFINGAAQAVTQEGMLALTLDRGEHSVYAELLDARGRKVITSAAVTFNIKQQTAANNAPRPTPPKPKPRSGT